MRWQTIGSTRRPATGGKRASRRRLGRGWRRVLIALLALVAAFSVATAWFIIWPIQGMPAGVSAIVMLDGPGDRIPVALALARQHRAPVLVVSQGVTVSGDPCPIANPGVRVICFHPQPSDTRGEAEYVGRLAKRYNWRSLVLITTREQDIRARVLMQRCFSGSVYVITASRAWYDWPYQIAYGWGSLIKALVLKRSC